MYKFIGIVTEISETTKVGKKFTEKQTFTCRSVDSIICFTLLGRNIELLQGISAYDKVEVEFSINSNCYGTTWYTNCTPIKITKVLTEQQKQEKQKANTEDQKKERRERRTESNGYQYKSSEDYRKENKPPPKPKSKNYFEGCYSDEQIKKRYRTLCFEHHPDRGGDAEIMKEVNVQHTKLCR